MSARYLVTGCAGFVGSHLVESLLDKGHAVVGVDAFTDAYARSAKQANLDRALRHERFALIEADLVEADLEPIVDGIDGIFHLAGRPGVRDSWGAPFSAHLRDNVLATQRLLEAARRTSGRVVVASSSSVYGCAVAFPTSEEAETRPISPYGVTKLGCEQLAAAYGEAAGIDAVVLRYFTVYGPRQRPDMALARIVAALARGGRFTLNGTGDQSRDWTYVEDAVAATVLAMERGRTGAVYNVGGGCEATLADAIALAERLTGRTLAVELVVAAAGDPPRTNAATARIRAEVGWEPQSELVDGLARQLEASGVGVITGAGRR